MKFVQKTLKTCKLRLNYVKLRLGTAPASTARHLHAEKPVEAGVAAVIVVARPAGAAAVPAAPLARVIDARWGAGRPGLVLLVAVEDDDAALLAPAALGLELHVRPALAKHLLANIVLLRPIKGGLVVGGHHVRVLWLHREQPRLGLRLDQAEGARGEMGTLIDDEDAAAGAAPERRLLRVWLDGAESRRAGGGLDGAESRRAGGERAGARRR